MVFATCSCNHKVLYNSKVYFEWCFKWFKYKIKTKVETEMSKLNCNDVLKCVTWRTGGIRWVILCDTQAGVNREEVAAQVTRERRRIKFHACFVFRVRVLNGISAGGYSKNNNYWLRLSIIGIIMEIEEDNTLWDLHNSSDDTKAEFNNCFIIHSK